MATLTHEEAAAREIIDFFDKGNGWKKNLRKKISRFFSLMVRIIFTIALLLFFMIIGVYWFRWDYKPIMKVLAFINVPLARVGGMNISFSKYFMRSEARTFYFNRESFGFKKIPSGYRNFFLNSIVEDAIIQRILEREGKDPDEKNINEKYAVFLDEVGSERLFRDQIKFLYGFDLEVWKELFFLPKIRREIFEKEFFNSSDQIQQFKNKERIWVFMRE